MANAAADDPKSSMASSPRRKSTSLRATSRTVDAVSERLQCLRRQRAEKLGRFEDASLGHVTAKRSDPRGRMPSEVSSVRSEDRIGAPSIVGGDVQVAVGALDRAPEPTGAAHARRGAGQAEAEAVVEEHDHEVLALQDGDGRRPLPALPLAPAQDRAARRRDRRVARAPDRFDPARRGHRVRFVVEERSRVPTEVALDHHVDLVVATSAVLDGVGGARGGRRTRFPARCGDPTTRCGRPCRTTGSRRRGCSSTGCRRSSRTAPCRRGSAGSAGSCRRWRCHRCR